MKDRKITIGSRSSELAIWQANLVKSKLEKHFPEKHFIIKPIKTTGEKKPTLPLVEIKSKGVFTKEIETALSKKIIDMAVHSLKDLQTTLPSGIIIGSILKREDARDVLISKNKKSIKYLPLHAIVATGSARRQSQLLAVRNDLRIVPMRGNLNTRFKKFYENKNLDAMILACAGISRLGWSSHVSEKLSLDTFTPAIGQGAIAIQIREEDTNLLSIAQKIQDKNTTVCTHIERGFLSIFEGGCSSPIGAHASIKSNTITFRWYIGLSEYSKPAYGSISMHLESIKKAWVKGKAIAENLLYEARRSNYST